MNILPHQVAGFFDEYFKGREQALRAISAVDQLAALAVEQREALEFSGFTNARSEETVIAAYAWTCKWVPFAVDFVPRSQS